MAYKVIRATEEYQRAGAYYVRIQAMARKYSITLRAEFDEKDGSPECRYIVILDNEFPVATCRWFPLTETEIEIGRVVVLPEYRGKGLGQLAVSEAENWAMETGYKVVSISSREEVTGFYEKLGYHYNSERQPHHDTFRCAYMEKDLGGLRYSVVGVGGIGGYYGARLAESGKTVDFLLRSDYDHVASNGLTVESVKGNIRLEKVNAYRDSKDMPKSDVVLVCIKTTGNDSLAEILRPLLKENTIIVLIQNGLGIEKKLQEELPQAHIVGATAFICSSKIAPGHVSHTAYGELTIAALGTGIEVAMDRIRDDFENCGVPCSVAPSLDLMRWRKLVWNIPYNGMSVVKNVKTDVLTFDPQYRVRIIALMNEVVNAAEACGTHIDSCFVDKMIAMTETMAPYFPSMYLDFVAGRRMELDTMYEAPVMEARRHGFEMTLTASLLAELREKEGR